MTATYEKIATSTLGSASASVTFSSISGTYTDLVLVVNAGASGVTDLCMRFNADTGTNYSRTQLRGTGSVADSERNSSTSRIVIGSIYTSITTTAIINIQNYSNSTTNKTAISRIGQANGYVTASVGLWRNTAAITEVLINGDGTDLSTGSTFTLYGIKAE